ncbi:MAG: hypothetical protein ACI9TH_003953, partial [Kiritimatiellia bacterium]
GWRFPHVRVGKIFTRWCEEVPEGLTHFELYPVPMADIESLRH